MAASRTQGTLGGMGFLDRLMFWKDSAADESTPYPSAGAEADYEIAGCFTLPDEPTADDACTPDVEPIDGNRKQSQTD